MMHKTRAKYLLLSALLTALVVHATLYLYVRRHRRESLKGKSQSPYLPREVLTDNQDELNQLRNTSVVRDLHKYDLDSMSRQQLIYIIHTYLDNTDIVCERKARMGNVGSGGWEICDDLDVRPTPPCVFYSFGINYDFSFDDDVARLYGCHVYSFDPGLKKMETHNRSSHVRFHKIGLSKKTRIGDRGWQLFSFQDLLQLLGHQKIAIDVIKMDIRGAEWSSLPNMLSSSQFANVRQLLVEYHIFKTKRNHILHDLSLLQAVERAGFKKFLVNKTPAGVTKISEYPLLRTCCYEVHYLKRQEMYQWEN